MINLFNKLFCNETIKEYKVEDPEYKNYIAGIFYNVKRLYFND